MWRGPVGILSPKRLFNIMKENGLYLAVTDKNRPVGCPAMVLFVGVKSGYTLVKLLMNS